MNEMEIRSNILSSFASHLKREEEESNKYRVDYEAKMQKEREERELRISKWRSENPNLDKYSYLSYYNHTDYHIGQSFGGGYCRIYFYEFSNIHSNPRSFSEYIPFYMFLDSCKIALSEAQNVMIKPLNECHCICKPNGELVIGATYEDMVLLFNGN